MATTIYAFNCNPLQIALTVRNAFTPYTFAGAGGTSTPPWIPQSPNTQIAWGASSPASGQLGYGTNDCVLNDGQSTTTFSIKIPRSVGPTDTLQIYLFYQAPPQAGQSGTVGWVLLQNGSPIGGNISSFAS